MKRLILVIVLSLRGCELCPAAQTPDFERIADAIKIAEGSNPHWWYGVHHKGKTPLAEPEARRRCINTLRGLWNHCPDGQDFISFVAPVYCGGDERRWERNVKAIIKQQNKKIK